MDSRVSKHPLQVNSLLTVRAGLSLPYDAPASDTELMETLQKLRITVCI